jgi:hypothetical protein
MHSLWNATTHVRLEVERPRGPRCQAQKYGGELVDGAKHIQTAAYNLAAEQVQARMQHRYGIVLPAQHIYIYICWIFPNGADGDSGNDSATGGCSWSRSVSWTPTGGAARAPCCWSSRLSSAPPARPPSRAPVRAASGRSRGLGVFIANTFSMAFFALSRA